ncbi:hypothetical protein [Pseudoroseomonas cervicalis]|uniref:hypothetical protein n=1 Tax=Teichococcus cervicalis TaxID=204525 RepID=UPI0022F19E71|nr:hypothetical protein [Pseudoroseomonas cervicalis]WBV42708.1 hypothetical protein PFY06_15910 [Pseudoroseomonas cervicalis]
MGWDLLLGRPQTELGPAGKAVIVTPELADYLNSVRHDPQRAAIALPVGATTIKRLRSLLGHHWRDDRAVYWLDRLPDLASLTGAEFAARHGVSEGAASQWRTALLGPRQRAPGWWREPAAAEALTTWPVAAAANAYGIAASSVRRLRAELVAGQVSPAHTPSPLPPSS